MNIIDVIISRLLLIFPEISRNIQFPENLQPYQQMTNYKKRQKHERGVIILLW